MCFRAIGGWRNPDHQDARVYLYAAATAVVSARRAIGRGELIVASTFFREANEAMVRGLRIVAGDGIPAAGLGGGPRVASHADMQIVRRRWMQVTARSR